MPDVEERALSRLMKRHADEYRELLAEEQAKLPDQIVGQMGWCWNGCNRHHEVGAACAP